MGMGLCSRSLLCSCLWKFINMEASVQDINCVGLCPPQAGTLWSVTRLAPYSYPTLGEVLLVPKFSQLQVQRLLSSVVRHMAQKVKYGSGPVASTKGCHLISPSCPLVTECSTQINSFDSYSSLVLQRFHSTNEESRTWRRWIGPRSQSRKWRGWDLSPGWLIQGPHLTRRLCFLSGFSNNLERVINWNSDNLGC
jgi:hypothetical protein